MSICRSVSRAAASLSQISWAQRLPDLARNLLSRWQTDKEVDVTLATMMFLSGCMKPSLIAYPLQYMEARELESAMHQLDGDGQGVASVYSDRRTNTVMVSATDEGHEWVVSLVETLDVDIDCETKKVHVIYLSYQDAQSMLSVLRGALPDMQIQADPATNSIVAVGEPLDVSALSGLITRLDVVVDRAADLGSTAED